jgi:PAS domain S-box-containing protein
MDEVGGKSPGWAREMLDISRLSVDLPRLRAGSATSYLTALAILAVATLIRLEVSASLNWLPYLTFFPAVVIVTLVCGGIEALLSAALSVVLAWVLFMPPQLTFENIYRTGMYIIGTGSVIFVAGAVRHTSQIIRRLNTTLGQSEAKFRGLLESAPDAMVIVDGAGRIVLVNAATERLFGYPRSQLLGKTADMLMPSNMADNQGAADIVGVRRDGSTFPIEVSHSPLQTEDGPMMSSAIRDVTVRKQIEAELMRASRAKSDFLSGMSHELRTPLNAIVGFAELLQMKTPDNSLTAKQQDYVAHILEGGNHLLVLVTQLLDLAGIEAGRLNLSIAAIDVGIVLRYVQGLMAPIAQKAEVNFIVDVPSAISDARADELRLRQVLLNFISNAIKYNNAGGEVRLTAETLAGGGIRFKVSDNGIGIPADRSEELFQPFSRLGAEHSAVSGTGIGLAFSRKVVEAMGGTVGFDSELGKGSTFWVDLPAEPSPVVASAEPAPARDKPFLTLSTDEAFGTA